MQIYLLLLAGLLPPILILDFKLPKAFPHRSPRSCSLLAWALLYGLPLLELFSFSAPRMRRISKFLFFLLRLYLIVFLFQLVFFISPFPLTISSPLALILCLALPLFLLPSSLLPSIFSCKRRKFIYQDSKFHVFSEQAFNCRAFIALACLTGIVIVSAVALSLMSDQSVGKGVALLAIIGLGMLYSFFKILLAVIFAKRKNKCCHRFSVDIVTAFLAKELSEGDKAKKGEKKEEAKSGRHLRRVVLGVTVRDKIREMQRKTYESKV